MHQHQQTFQENASTTSLVERFIKRQSTLQRETNRKEIFQLAKDGNEEAIEEIDELLYYLAEGIANLCYILNPEMVLLGGGIMEQTEYLQPRLEKMVEEKLIPKMYKNTKIAFVLEKNHAGMIGA
jgi:predicted NBD/HSP70 family sugar kinase